MYFEVFSRDYGVLYLFDYVRGDIMPSVGDSGRKVGDLKWGCKNLTLSDRYRDDGVGTPMTGAIPLVVEVDVRDEATVFAG